jgi:hypothetical protein
VQQGSVSKITKAIAMDDTPAETNEQKSILENERSG